MKQFPIKRSSHFLFTRRDEDDFSSKVRESFPGAVFIDGVRWPEPRPPTKRTMSCCEEKWVYLWNPAIYPILPFERTNDGQYRGPQAGMVIQIERSRTKGRIMLSGDLAIGISVPREGVRDMIDFAESVWKIFKGMGVRKAVQLDPSSLQPLRTRRDILVGREAAEWCRSDPEKFFMFNNSPHIFMKPAE